MIHSLVPQTYSRIFRPWDGAKSTPDHHHRNDDDDQMSASSSSDDATITDTFAHTYAPTFFGLPKDRQLGFARPTADSPTAAMPTPSQPESTIHHNHQQPTNYLGIRHPYGQAQDQFSAAAAAAAAASTYMEDMALYAAAHLSAFEIIAGSPPFNQEYVRVLTEDAETKMNNSRKQRPKKYKCPHCNVAFSNNGQLKGHVRIHTGERPFKCDEPNCKKTFTRNEELTRHKRIHTGLRPYHCSTCGKSFGRRDHLKKHEKTHLVPYGVGSAVYMPMLPYSMYGF